MKILLAMFGCAVLWVTALAATPVATGVMVGAPPPAAQQVTLDNWLSPEFNAWSFQHLEAILPTTTVDRGTGPVSALDAQPYDLGRFEFADFTGKKRNLAQFLDDQHIDGLVLWSHGKLRQEIYRNGETARTRHLMMSVTKSFTGLIAEMLIAEGKLDETKQVTDYVPELKGERLRRRDIAQSDEHGDRHRFLGDLRRSEFDDLPVQLRSGIPSGAARREAPFRRCTSSCRR